ncbi:MAG: molybdopterin cofactor-binding domain-containing protein, partial [Pseudomonadota bacterium]|nr:molybdopterin cofactor-binding domain-containing protein [Pseudomonadota bacterium]
MVLNPSIVNNPDLDQWVEVANDQRIIIHTGKVEIGQRITTALAMIAAEELSVSYNQIDIKRTETGIDPNEGFTAGSNSTQHSGGAVRLASATARMYMLEIAAKEMDVEIDSLEIENGLIQSRNTNRTVTYWDLMAGKKFAVKIDPEAKIKSHQDYSVIGTHVVSKGITEIVTGKKTFVQDIKMPGMLHARLVRPPHYLASLAEINKTALENLKASNVKVIRDGSFLAVANADEYRAIKAANRLSSAVDWNLNDGLAVNDLYDSLTTNDRVSLPVVGGGAPVDKPVPPLQKPPSEATKTISARFEKPYHMHGSIGPSAGCAIYKNGRLTVWTQSQGVYPLRKAIAAAFDMIVEHIQVIFVEGAGCYGHNGADDAAFEAALIARFIPETPILLKWTRDDEHAWEPYGSAMVL